MTEPGNRLRFSLARPEFDDDAAGIHLDTWRRPLGYVFQEASLFPHLDVRANLDFGLRRIRRAGSIGW